MIMSDYFESVAKAIEFLIAVGSVLGFLGLVIGILGLMYSGPFYRHKMIGVIVFSIILLAVCGLYTGLKYFRIKVY